MSLVQSAKFGIELGVRDFGPIISNRGCHNQQIAPRLTCLKQGSQIGACPVASDDNSRVCRQQMRWPKQKCDRPTTIGSSVCNRNPESAARTIPDISNRINRLVCRASGDEQARWGHQWGSSVVRKTPHHTDFDWFWPGLAYGTEPAQRLTRTEGSTTLVCLWYTYTSCFRVFRGMRGLCGGWPCGIRGGNRGGGGERWGDLLGVVGGVGESRRVEWGWGSVLGLLRGADVRSFFCSDRKPTISCLSCSVKG